MLLRISLLLIVALHLGKAKLVEESKLEAKNAYYDGKKTSIPISAESGEELMQHWVDQAIGGLMAAVSTKQLARLKPRLRKQVHVCNKQAKSTSAHAKCVVLAMELAKHEQNLVPEEIKKNKTLIIGEARDEHAEVLSKSFKIKLTKKQAFRKHSKRINKEQTATKEQRKQNRLRKLSRLPHRKPKIRRIAKLRRKIFRKFGLRKISWRTIIAEITEKAKEIKAREKVRNVLRKRQELYSNAAKLSDDDDDLDLNSRRPLAMPNLDDLDEEIERNEMLANARAQMSNMTQEQKAMAAPMQLVREAVKLGLMMSGKNITDFENKNLNLISPRFFSVMPEDDTNKKDEINLLSPSVFSLHNEGEGLEKRLSMAKMLETVGLDADTQELMNMIIEVSGVGEAVKNAKNSKFAEYEKTEGLRGPNGEPLYWTKKNVSETLGSHEVRKIDHMEHLQRMYTARQLEEMRDTGYTALTPRQLDFVYGKHSPYNDSEALDKFLSADLSRSSVENAVHTTIHELAAENAKFSVSRKRDIVLSPVAFMNFINDPVAVSQPVILSPVIFSSLICSPAIFGAIILSPWLFVGVVLSPRILSPVVLTPFGFVPIILTPLALTPIILAPGIFNPFVLSPLVLCPFVLSPQAFTPLILSPFALTPFILTPNVLSPIVLSPFVLSPIILSPAYVSALVLSPYALSPAIKSTGAVFSVFASPSFLS